MKSKLTVRRFAAVTATWTVAAILGLTVALLAVGLLGLWVAVGAFAGLGTTVVSGLLGQTLFVTDFDEILSEAPSSRDSRDKTS